MVKGEPADKWLMFLTNQATEDHIVTRRISQLEPIMSARVHARVAAPPRTIAGGHVIVRVSDGDECDAAFYEHSRSLRVVARELLPGDELMLYGSVRATPRSLNVEKLLIMNLIDDVRKIRNPVCTECGKSMGSMGTNQGYRCKKCGAKAGPERASWETRPRVVKCGWYEPPVASRRHLHKPLRRMSRGDVDKLKYAHSNQSVRN